MCHGYMEQKSGKNSSIVSKLVELKFYWNDICSPGSVVKSYFLLTVSKQGILLFLWELSDNLPDSGQGWNTETTFRVCSKLKKFKQLYKPN